MSRSRLLTYRAGPAAIRRLREAGLEPRRVGAFVAPASGPKWLVLAGIDRALLRAGFFAAPEENDRRLLVGASAGAWRVAALASRDPHAAHRALLDGYVGQILPRGMTPDDLTKVYSDLLSKVYASDDVEHALGRSGLDLGFFTARLRSRIAAESRFGQGLLLAAAALLSPFTSRAADAINRRTLFTTSPDFIRDRFGGDVVSLHRENYLDAVFASGRMPVYFRGVRNPADAPEGLYFDGGLSDYHFRQPGLAPDRLVLFPHYLDRIIPAWFDKKFPHRRPSAEATDNLLMMHPSSEFMARLPDQRLPDRDEFFRFVDAPQERIRRWHEAAKLSDDLGEEFLDDLQAGRIADLAEPF